ncbi:hypothetical protein LVJ94_47885 [Pendulispora rubella]|uniref:Uncharacterized protein n=1 Tax=Pendulispora rubella TaxID=2741070 RepID=A0ABZ2L7B1_9BACT
MNLDKTKLRIGLGILFGATALGVLISSNRSATAAEPAPDPNDFAARGCTLAWQAHDVGRDINLWRCGSQVHAQIASARKGDTVWLSQTPEQKSTVRDGWTFANTQDSFSPPELGVRACGRVVGRNVVCN